MVYVNISVAVELRRGLRLLFLQNFIDFTINFTIEDLSAGGRCFVAYCICFRAQNNDNF